MSKLPAFMTSLTLLTALATNAIPAAGESSITVKTWGKLPSGEEVKLYTLTNNLGMQVTISNYGGLITSLCVPDKEGKMEDVILGFDTLEEYMEKSPYFGAVVGRYGNRIGGGTFTIDGTAYQVTKNEKGIQCLHGGNVGFDKKIWDVEEITSENLQHDRIDTDKIIGLKLTLISPDGEEGFPGTINTVLHYMVPKDTNLLVVLYGATTDKPTHLNLTQHAYFNMKGAGNGDILDHEVTIWADRFTPVDENLIPTGELRDVTGTAMDFRQPNLVGARIDADEEQIKIGGGYDHNWVLNVKEGENFRKAAKVRDPASGRTMEVFTTEPGVQFYAGNFMSTMPGKGGKTYVKRGGLCFETQHFPDSPNKPQFPSTLVKPGEEYKSATIFKFSAE
ncbi:MAG: aldose epimerase family protein [Planctomycetia bacterium]|nr:aldose epimerase family protein [Planctomycetia bacterium]